jgi:hypothetical protein
MPIINKKKRDCGIITFIYRVLILSVFVSWAKKFLARDTKTDKMNTL